MKSSKKVSVNSRASDRSCYDADKYPTDGERGTSRSGARKRRGAFDQYS